MYLYYDLLDASVLCFRCLFNISYDLSGMVAQLKFSVNCGVMLNHMHL